MPATQFICPFGQRVPITECLRECPNAQRCMFLPTLRAVANSLDRKIIEPTITELIAEVQNPKNQTVTFLKIDLLDILRTHAETLMEFYERGRKYQVFETRDEVLKFARTGVAQLNGVTEATPFMQFAINWRQKI